MFASPSLAGDPPPTVSVIIPAFNYVRFLPQAIDSALQQTFPALEILVIDDGSTDDTAQVVAARYGQMPQVRYLHQTNAGLSAARNTGIRHARGEFVAFLDADDQWKPNFLKEVTDCFVRLPEDFALVATRSTLLDGAGALLPRKQLLEDTDREITCADIILKTRFSPSAVVVRRHVFTDCGDFDPALRSSEDRDMWIRIAARHRIHLCGQQLIFFRRHGTGMSAHAGRMKENIRRTFEKARQNPDITGLPPFFWFKVFSFFRFQTAWMYFEESRRNRALSNLLLSCLLWPCFGHTRRLNESAWFRLRSLGQFIAKKKTGR